MSLSQSFQVALTQALQVAGGMTSSIFPQAEALLIDSTEHVQALEFIGARKNMDRYESVMDFLFCEIFPQFRWSCFRYYREEGPPLRDTITVEQLVFFSQALLVALDMAYDIFSEQRRVSWNWYANEVRQKLAA